MIGVDRESASPIRRENRPGGVHGGAPTAVHGGQPAVCMRLVVLVSSICAVTTMCIIDCLKLEMDRIDKRISLSCACQNVVNARHVAHLVKTTERAVLPAAERAPLSRFEPSGAAQLRRYDLRLSTCIWPGATSGCVVALYHVERPPTTDRAQCRNRLSECGHCLGLWSSMGRNCRVFTAGGRRSFLLRRRSGNVPH